MYRKTTFSKSELLQTSDRLQNISYKSDDMSGSHLIWHDDHERAYIHFDTDMPYLILYELFAPDSDRSVYLEFSEHRSVSASTPYSELIKNKRHVSLHTHDFYEVTFVMSGQLTMQIENDRITYNAGEGCICNKNIHHEEIPDSDAELVMFLLKDEYVGSVFSENYYYDKSGSPKIRKNVFDTIISEDSKNPFYNMRIYIDFRLEGKKVPDDFLKTVNEMITSISGTGSGKSHMMKALFCRFFEMIEDKSLYRSEIHWAKLSNEEQIIENISNAYKNKTGVFSREEIEQITGYNGDYVERIIKKSMGMTLLKFGRTIMLKKVADRLLNSKESISDICESFGYSNRYHFNKIFEQHYGMTPAAYRRAAIGK